MNVKTSLLLFLFSLVCTTLFAQKDSVLICDVKFGDSKFDNAHAGSGFLLEYEDRVYAITAKHVLFFAKTDRMKTILLDEDLISWNFCSKTTIKKCVTAGKLINEDKTEAIEMPPKGDWLIFDVGENIPPDMTVHTMRDSPLIEGEPCHFKGFPYDSDNAITIHGKYIGRTPDNNLRLDVPQGKYNGCSGGPVLDANGNLIGLVSMGYFNAKEEKMIFEPASLDYFMKVMDGQK